MLLTARIKLTSPVLGELKADQHGVRRFKRDAGLIRVNLAEWESHLILAARQLGARINPKTIIPNARYRPASPRLFRRVFNKIQVELFESFQTGTVLSLEFLIREDMEWHPKPEQFHSMLRVIGNYTGISQFGNKFGFGRFEVLSIDPTLKD